MGGWCLTPARSGRRDESNQWSAPRFKGILRFAQDDRRVVMPGTAKLFGLAWRESRTARRRLLLYMSSISLGVAALVAIDSFSENVIASVHDQSRSLMGGDVEMM